MAERHGVFITEQPASVITPVRLNVTLPVVFGTAPINLSTLDAAPVNKPILCESWADAVAAFGYSDNWDDFTLSEFMHFHFKISKQSPVVFINVLDPVKHATSVTAASYTLVNGTLTVAVQGIIKTSVLVTSDDGATTYILGTDYALSFNDAGHLVVSRIASGALASGAKVKVGYSKLDQSKVTSADIIGGMDVDTGIATGLELLDQIFPLFRIVPGLIAAPGFSQNPVVGAIMVVKANSLNGGHFKATPLTDLPSNLVYSEIAKWKKDNAYTDPQQINTYPLATKDGLKYRMSTVVAAATVKSDVENQGIPSTSPSNTAANIDGTTLTDRDFLLGPQQAQYLNAQGIVTALNFVEGFVVWGNRTGVYPDAKDPQSSFIPVRRMFNWVGNTLTLTYWKYLDDPTNKKMIEAITDSVNVWINGLVAAGYLLGGRVEFNASENPQANLIDGKLKFHVFITPPSPGQDIDFVLEYDASYFASLFAA
ncbi:phage tail sheath family protein [Paenibacillus polymyxa]|uniref:phage tail sheath family protein n=1 Tax=Paenibacillus polymyxa TaxID=1406 RepID=UPI0007EBC99D|nr:phage tail protein [Paenibacillus polymyxa]OAZ43336.1 phage tail protein [Paenibacillus polymyxa]